MKNIKIVAFLAIMIFLVSLLLTMRLFMNAQVKENWLTGWKYRKSHVVNSAYGAGLGYQVRIKTLYDAEPFEGYIFYSSVLEHYVTVNAWDSSGRLYAIKRDEDGLFKLFWATDSNPANLKLKWAPPVSLNEPHYIRCLFIDSRDHIFISSWNPNPGKPGWLWRSTDGGQTFTEVLNISVWGMTEDSDGYLYVGRYENWLDACEVYKSSDGGTNWTNISASSWLGQRHVHNVLIDPSTGWLYAALGDWGVCAQGVWRSKLKDGTDWVWKGPSISDKYAFVGMAVKDGYIYLGSDVNDGCIWRFKDDGTHDVQVFEIIHNDDLDMYIYYLRTDNCGRLWAGILCSGVGQTKLLTSNDGTTWEVRIIRKQIYGYETFQFGTTKFSSDNVLLIQYGRETLKAWFEYYAATDEVNLKAHCRADFGDVRFTNDDGVTLLDYWIEEKVDGEHAIFWVELAVDLDSHSIIIYIYYGKNDETTKSNGVDTFQFFDDFSTNTLSHYTETCDLGGSPAFSFDSTNQRIQGSTMDCMDHHLIHNTYIVANSKIGVKIISGKDSGVTFRFRSQNDLYEIGIHDSTYDMGPCLRIWKRVGSAFIEIGSPIWISNIEGSVHQIYLGFYKQHLHVWWDGSLIIGGIDLGSNFSSGKFGLRLYEGTCYYDDLRVSKFVYPEPTHGPWGNEELAQQLTFS